MSTLAAISAPHIDYDSLSPLIALVGGSIAVLMLGLLPGRPIQRVFIPLLAVASLGIAAGLAVWNWDKDTKIIEGALAIDNLTLGMSMLFFAAGILTVLLSLRSDSMRQAGAGEYYSLLIGSITGMVVLAAASNLVAVFIGLELLSIPLYVLCATLLRHEPSLEAGLKYLVIGSVGSATLLYGLAFVYGATGATDFSRIEAAIGDGVQATDPLLLTGVALALAGLAFKASVAPFHQWTPDVYQGAPTPITAFMAASTKVAAFAVLIRLLVEALPALEDQWAPALTALAVTTIVVGNVGALTQSSLKRMLAWSAVAQAGYMLAGVVVGTRLGVQATWFYLAAYLVMNTAAFAVILARERVHELGDDIRALEGLGRASPWLAWPMTIAMLSLAGFPATAGFIGKLYLIDASVADGYEGLGVMIVVGSMISLAYYLRVVAMMWMGPIEIELPGPRPRRRVKPVAGWSPEADARAQPEVLFVAVLCGAGTLVLGIVPSPLFDVARDVGAALF
jgi:NADH-quinone oxidoreductase subunit N